jgi:hypothetical protein
MMQRRINDWAERQEICDKLRFEYFKTGNADGTHYSNDAPIVGFADYDDYTIVMSILWEPHVALFGYPVIEEQSDWREIFKVVSDRLAIGAYQIVERS